MPVSKTEPMGTKDEIVESLKARAEAMCGRERAKAIESSIELTASHVWQLSQDLPTSEEEPAFYF